MSEPIPVQVGKKYNKLTIFKEVERHVQPNGRTRRLVEVVCDCGKTKVIHLESLYAGYSKTCGCSHIEHGLTGTKFKNVHTNMKARCDNPNHPSYPNYGGRGITYDKSWKSLKKFAEDMLGTYQEGLTIDRIDVNADYSKENCRWVGDDVQEHNKRKQEGCEFMYKGIRYNLPKTRYVAVIKECYLATFDVLEHAAKGYDDASELLYNDRPNGTAAQYDWIYEVILAKLKQKNLIES